MEWKKTTELLPYPEALAAMAARVEAIQKGEAEELCWLVEHPPLYTLGTSAKASDVLGSSPHRGEVRRGADTRQDINREVTLCGSPPPNLPPMGGGVPALPTYETGRGGQVTYHGPGQRVVYVMRDLKKHAGENGPDLRAYVQQLEQWIILTLAQFGIDGFTREGRVGVWVEESPIACRQSPVTSHQSPVASDGAARSVAPSPLAGEGWDGGAISAAPFSPPLTQSSPAGGEGFSSASVPSTTHHSLRTTHEKKIAALGVRVQKWVTSHGIAINVNPDLSHYAGIIPCGIREFGVTSMLAMGVDVGMEEVDVALKSNFAKIFV